MFIALGTLFVLFQGTSALEGFYAANGATDLAFAVERWVNALAESAPIALMLGVGLLPFLAKRDVGPDSMFSSNGPEHLRAAGQRSETPRT